LLQWCANEPVQKPFYIRYKLLQEKKSQEAREAEFEEEKWEEGEEEPE
jgi:hypothetical protein